MNLYPVLVIPMIGSLKQQEVREIVIQTRNFFWEFSDDFQLQGTDFLCVTNGLRFNDLRFGEAQRFTCLSQRGKLDAGNQVPVLDSLVVLRIPDHSRNLFSQIAVTYRILHAPKRVFESRE